MTKGRITMAKRAASKIDRKLTKPDTPVRGRPRQQDLPGTEDRAIKPLEEIAASYAEWRDRRMELGRQEVELKQQAIKLMHKYGKTTYRHNGIEILLKEGQEDIKVKVRKDEPEDDEDETDDAVVVGADEAQE